jgi:crotonobetainyl-CoA:carnitine CoA-transferase CaiB-like acyl-CoA transferase
MGRPGLADDPRFATPLARRENWDALFQAVCEWLNGFDDVEQALAALTGARIPSVPMLSPEEVIEHPHLVARNAFPAVEHPVRGPVRVTATPFHLDSAPVAPAGAAPHRVGEHTHAVLTKLLGYPEERVQALLREKAIEVPGR